MRQFGSGFKNTLAQMEGPYGGDNGFGSAFAGGQGLHLSDLMGPFESEFGQMPELTQMEGPFEFGRKRRRSGRKSRGRKSRRGSRRGRKSRRGSRRGRKSGRKSKARKSGRKSRRSGRKSRKASRRGRKSRRASGRKMSKKAMRKIKTDLKMFKKGMCRKTSGGFKKCTKSQSKRVTKLMKMF